MFQYGYWMRDRGGNALSTGRFDSYNHLIFAEHDMVLALLFTHQSRRKKSGGSVNYLTPDRFESPQAPNMNTGITRY